MKLGQQHIVPQIEFPLLIQQWSIEIQLDNESLLSTIVVLLFCLHYRIELVDLINYSDSVSSVC